MFNVFGRKKRDDKPTPPWLMWLVVIFLGYSVLSSQNKSSSVHQGVEQIKTTLENQQTFKLDDYKQALNPKQKGLRIREISPGSGPPAICGEQVSIAYSAVFPGDIPAKEKATREEPLTLRIGEGKAAAMFEEGLTGMQVGGKRSLIAPASMSPVDPAQKEGLTPDTLVKLDVELLAITESLQDAFSTPYRIADAAPGSGAMIRCGEPVKAHVTLWDIAGKKLFSTRDDKRGPLEFTPGKSEVFVGLEQGVIGMNRGGLRTLVVPPAFLGTLQGNKPALDLGLGKKNETILVDVEALP